MPDEFEEYIKGFANRSIRKDDEGSSVQGPMRKGSRGRQVMAEAMPVLQEEG